MPQNTGNKVKSYEDITRATVIEPDSSFRPTVAQERGSYEGERVLSGDERAIYDRTSDALRSAGCDVSAVTVEVDGSRVTLRGRVRDYNDLPKIEAAVRTVPDVGDIVDMIVIDPGV